MSGGSFDYGYFKVQILADEIENMFVNDGKYEGEDYSISQEDLYDYKKSYRGTRPMVEYDRIGDATPEERVLILNEVHKLIKDLNNCAFRAKELEWYMSGDTSATSYLKRLKDKGLI
jgi:nicotinic acid phosphoribosyltransferase